MEGFQNLQDHPPIKGINNETTTLRTAPKMALLFVSGFAPDVNKEDVLKLPKK